MSWTVKSISAEWRNVYCRARVSGVFPIKLFEPVEAVKEEANGGFSLPVDLIRVSGIFLVVLLHVTNTFYDQIYQSPFNAGSWWTYTVYKSLSLPCVPLFVILSGALLLQPSKINEPIKFFLKKRVNRIGLAFCFWTAIYIVWGFYVTKAALTLNNVNQSIIISLFTGAHYQFWFLYLIAGLYLVTPVLRAVIGFNNPKLVSYLIILWLIGIAVVPLVPLFTSYSINGEVFIIGGYIGYFLLGFYLQNARMRRGYAYSFVILGILLTIGTTWIMNFPLHPLGQYYYFFDYLAINVVVASIALYALLSRFNGDWPGANHPQIGKLTQLISQNTLPIYLFHVMIVEALVIGAFGFTLNLTYMPIVEIPVVAVAILLLTLGLVLLMKKVPILRRLIG